MNSTSPQPQLSTSFPHPPPGDDDLLEIQGQSKNPAVIQSHLKKLFAGIHKVGGWGRILLAYEIPGWGARVSVVTCHEAAGPLPPPRRPFHGSPLSPQVKFSADHSTIRAMQSKETEVVDFRGRGVRAEGGGGVVAAPRAR